MLGTAPSADGKGRTLWEILTGANKKDMSPLELQYHNPLKAKLGVTISFEHDQELQGINFVVEKIAVYTTEVNRKKFYHTDYLLKGVTLGSERPIRLRLRLVPNQDSVNDFGCDVQVLRLMDEFAWDEGFYNGVLLADNGEFHIDVDMQGNPVDPAIVYWRVEDVRDPYAARVTVLADDDGDGTVEDEELEHYSVEYFDYSRIAVDETTKVEQPEYLWVEKNEETGYFHLYRVGAVHADHIFVI